MSVSVDNLFTIVGAHGYIGSRLIHHLQNCNAKVTKIDRFDETNHIGQNLGHVIFAAGVTADFRQRPFDTMGSHISAAVEILRQTTFKSFLYLSSTRVYQNADNTLEDSALRIEPKDPLQLYNASKLAGEAICLAQTNKKIRVARLSNVYGVDDPSQNFLADVVHDAIKLGQVTLQTNPRSNKDFVSIEDVISILPRIAVHGVHRVYNVASGKNTRYGDILKVLRAKTGCTIVADDNNRIVSFPMISVARLVEEFEFSPTWLMDDISDLVGQFQDKLK